MRHNKPLYRKMNRRSLHCSYNIKGGHYKWQRHTKEEKKLIEDEVSHGKMHKRPNAFNVRKYDYTPLLMYLLNCVGKDVDKVFSEVCKRVDNDGRDVFNLMVSRKPKEELKDYFRYGEGSLYSQLYVDDENKIQKVNPNLSNYSPHYGGSWGESLNGKPLSLQGNNSGSKFKRKWWHDYINSHYIK